MKRLLKSWFSSTRSVTRRAPAARFGIEALEDRRVPTVGPMPGDDNILYISGTAGSDHCSVALVIDVGLRVEFNGVISDFVSFRPAGVKF